MLNAAFSSARGDFLGPRALVMGEPVFSSSPSPSADCESACANSRVVACTFGGTYFPSSSAYTLDDRFFDIPATTRFVLTTAHTASTVHPMLPTATAAMVLEFHCDDDWTTVTTLDKLLALGTSLGALGTKLYGKALNASPAVPDTTERTGGKAESPPQNRTWSGMLSPFVAFSRDRRN